MRFKRVSEHIARLELPWRLFGAIKVPLAVHLIRGGNAFHLIDTGVPDSADLLVKALREATRGQGPQSVLLTHAHHDHAGGLNALQIAWRPQVVCHRDEAPFVTGELSYSQLSSSSFAFWLGSRLMPNPGWAVKLTRLLDGGQSFAGLVAIHLPGHSPGSVGFLHPEDNVIICGDALMNLMGRLTSPFRLATQDARAARESIYRLAELDCRMLLPSHGRPITGDVGKKLLRFLDRSAR